ncbi:MAG: glycosyltransferase family 2 protein [Cyclobacteriaceae bacterium]|nr:glycosyltransferase family 2 protein [Cyclobacteriaceae bacterium]
MKVVGFTFIRNAITYQYPIVEAIKSILPLCDSIIVGVGKSDDETLELINSIDSDKIIIHETIWDDDFREGGQVLAQETDKSYKLIPDDADWAFYIQGDEVLHDDSIDNIRNAMQEHKDNPDVEGLLFKYRHFYGSYDYIGDSYRWYHREVRVLRKREDIFSFNDAQGFRKKPNIKLNVKLIDAYIHHYGWVKTPDAMQLKQKSFHKMWHDDEWLEKNIPKGNEFDFSKIDSLKLFKGKHPEVMNAYINRHNWKFDYDISTNKLKTKDKIKRIIERLTGIKLSGNRNYNLLK